MRNGQRVFDADTHFQPSVESIVPYFDAALRDREEELAEFKNPVTVGRAGQILEEPYRHWYRFAPRGGWGAFKPRHLGEAGPRENEQRRFQQFMGRRQPTPGAEDYDVDVRVREMDEEGVDAQLLVPGAFTGHKDPAVDVGLLQAHHRYIDDTCGRYPDRLYSMIVTSAHAVEESAAEIRKWAGSRWASGIYLELPLDYPLDHPDLHPLWAAADEADLCVIHHSFATGYPGYRDLWDNPFIGRTAGHPWAAMRAVAAFMGSGLMDQYPNLRYSILESGFGWLPFWTKRMQDQITYMGYVNEHLQHTMDEYMTGGRFFAGIVIHEGEEMVRMVTELMGDGVLMFGSDYPHSESRFPDSVDIVMGWQSLGAEAMRKLMWDNSVNCYRIT
jgi:predicted TIM-barrel fold metal-dependent hydrolase